LRKHQPLILAELENGGGPDGNTARSARLLEGLGYRLFDVSAGAPRPVRIDDRTASNVVAAPERFLDQVLTLGGLTRAALTSADGA